MLPGWYIFFHSIIIHFCIFHCFLPSNVKHSWTLTLGLHNHSSFADDMDPKLPYAPPPPPSHTHQERKCTESEWEVDWVFFLTLVHCTIAGQPNYRCLTSPSHRISVLSTYSRTKRLSILTYFCSSVYLHRRRFPVSLFSPLSHPLPL